MTDDVGRSDGRSDVPTDEEADVPTDEATETPRGPRAASEVDFADLSLPQRVFVAAVQNPTRGVVIVALFAFAFSFYIAFWMVFPRIAAVFSVLVVVLGVALGVVYYLFDRYVD
ncbi:Flp pilus assembly protein TadB [Halorubrum alkaliphilum]|uniref:Flp pilus assembly protein TadB n=1 Tax=Halorubrum alkaliphilum TaxID=261290 RepID=A0A8T4GEQ4_9EURY|nr:hypothetical protein [Halorubrum alkaliphilum]MBP1922968.1 Flp pilus assembly protein TadB [Halorubrum alkaliphilum]